MPHTLNNLYVPRFQPNWTVQRLAPSSLSGTGLQNVLLVGGLVNILLTDEVGNLAREKVIDALDMKLVEY